MEHCLSPFSCWISVNKTQQIRFLTHRAKTLLCQNPGNKQLHSSWFPLFSPQQSDSNCKLKLNSLAHIHPHTHTRIHIGTHRHEHTHTLHKTCWNSLGKWVAREGKQWPSVGLSSTSCSSSTEFDKWSLNSVNAKTKHFSTEFLLHGVYTRSRILWREGEQGTSQELSGAETRLGGKAGREGRKPPALLGIHSPKNPKTVFKERGKTHYACVKIKDMTFDRPHWWGKGQEEARQHGGNPPSAPALGTDGCSIVAPSLIQQDWINRNCYQMSLFIYGI